MQYSLCMLKKNVNPSVVVKQFCTTLGMKIVQKTFQLNSIRYFGPPSAVNRLWIVKLSLSLETTVSYTKLVKNGCLFTSSGNIRFRRRYRRKFQRRIRRRIVLGSGVGSGAGFFNRAQLYVFVIILVRF